MNACGNCTLCCKLMAVTELDKPARQWCAKADPTRGCTDYPARPASCAEYECVWLVSQRRPGGGLAPELRPDRSRVVLNVGLDGTGIVFHVDPSRPAAHQTGAAGELLESVIQQGQDVVIVVGDQRTEIPGRG